MSPETATLRFCEAMLDLARGPLPGQVSRAARRTLINVIGTAVSAVDARATSIILEQAGLGVAEPAAGVVPGRYGVAHPYWAALATGTAAHLDDFDDTHLATVIHPGACVLATVLALAPAAAPSGAGLLGAFAAGCEAQLRIGNAISPAHYDHGWHITGTCGVFGAAITASALLGLDAEAAERAMSLAAVMTAGHREAFGSMTKPLHAGKAAANGILAAWLAGRAGLAGPGDPLGPGGVLETLAGGADNVNWPALDIGGQLEHNTFKTYPCGVVAHPAMDAAVEAFPLVGDSSSITGVSVTCNPLVLELMGRRHPHDGLSSRFSARHGIAAGLRYGRAGLSEFTDDVANDPEMTRLRDLIELDPDPSCARDAASLRVAVRDGHPVEVRVEHARGSAARPLTDAELVAKAASLADPVLGDTAAARIRDVVHALRAADGISDLLAVIRPAAAPAVPGVPSGAPASGPSAGPASAPEGFDAAFAPAVAPMSDAAPATDVLLALALAPPALADELVVADQAAGEAKLSLAAFGAALESGEGTAVQQAVEAALDASVLPEGHALTAFGSAAAAMAGTVALDTETAIVCAAAAALGDNCAEPVAIGLDVTGLVAAGLPDAAARGWSVPVISAAVGATVAAGLMLGLPEPQLRAAIGIAATQAAGLAAAEGTDAAALQAGKAAFNAVEAAQLAAAGFTSSAQPLEGRRGLYAVFSG
jgi:2-methylcitrate dehydratase PrpD